MRLAMRLPAVAGIAVVGLSAGVGSAMAGNPPLPNLVNLNFVDYTGISPKGSFTSVDPVGWTGGSGLIFIASPCTGTCVPGSPNDQSAAGPVYLQTYGNPTGNIKGNYVEADGNPTFESGFNYEVTGLTPGTTYSLTFAQGASQQVGFGPPGTTNQWIVSLGTEGMTIDCSGGAFCTYSNSDPNASVQLSPLMTVPYGGVVGWQDVTVNLKADGTSDLLSFLAWGNEGATANLPPMAFLTGVNSAIPEPSTWAMMGLGFLGLAGVAWRRKAKAPVLAHQG